MAIVLVSLLFSSGLIAAISLVTHPPGSLLILLGLLITGVCLATAGGLVLPLWRQQP
jgi:hypothetical protein